MSGHDKQMFRWVREFSPYDLYSKGAVQPDVQELRPDYEDLIAKYFPTKLSW